MIWNGKTISTVGDLFDAASACKTQDEANAFLSAYRNDNPEADANLGYVIGYADAWERKRLYDLFKLGHPIFGNAV